MQRVFNTIVKLLVVIHLGMGCCCWHHGTDAVDCCQSDSTCHPDICGSADDHPEVCGSADDHPEVCGGADEHPEVPSFRVTRHDGADFHYGCGHGRCTFVKNSSFERMLVEMGQAGFCQGLLMPGQSGSFLDGCGFRPIPLLLPTRLRIHLLNCVMLL